MAQDQELSALVSAEADEAERLRHMTNEEISYGTDTQVFQVLSAVTRFPVSDTLPPVVRLPSR